MQNVSAYVVQRRAVVAVVETGESGREYTVPRPACSAHIFGIM